MLYLTLLIALLSYISGRCDPLIASGHGSFCCLLRGFLREATERIRMVVLVSRMRCDFSTDVGMRVEAYDEQLWCQMLDWRPSVVFLHVGGNDISYEQQGHIGEMILELVRSLEAAGMYVHSRGNIASYCLPGKRRRRWVRKGSTTDKSVLAIGVCGTVSYFSGYRSKREGEGRLHSAFLSCNRVHRSPRRSGEVSGGFRESVLPFYTSNLFEQAGWPLSGLQIYFSLVWSYSVS